MLKELRTQHRTIVQMSFNGFKNNEIAEKMGMNPATISGILRSPLGQAYLNGLIDKAQEDTIDVRKKLISLNQGALGTLERILDPKHKAPFNVQLTAAKDVLDRNGYKPSDKFEIDVFSHKTDDEIESEIRAMEAAINRTQLINAAADTPDDQSDLPSTSADGSEDSSESEFGDPALDAPDSGSASTLPASDPSGFLSAASIQNNDELDSLDDNSPDLPLIKFPKSAFPPNHSALPPDVQEKLSDETFDPFNNI